MSSDQKKIPDGGFREPEHFLCISSYLDTRAEGSEATNDDDACWIRVLFCTSKSNSSCSLMNLQIAHSPHPPSLFTTHGMTSWAHNHVLVTLYKRP